MPDITKPTDHTEVSETQRSTLRNKVLHGRNVTHIGLFLGVCIGMSLALPLGFVDATWRDPAPPPLDPLLVMALVTIGFSFVGYIIGGVISMRRMTRALPITNGSLNTVEEGVEYPPRKEENNE